MTQKTYLSWDDVEHMLDEVVAKLPSGSHFTGVYGLPRGGLVPAVMLSHRLDIPLLAAASPGCLVLDDIADSGITLKHYSDLGYKIAVLVYKFHRSEVRPDYSGLITNDPNWVVFPWEKK